MLRTESFGLSRRSERSADLYDGLHLYLTNNKEKIEIENEKEVHQRKADSARAGMTFDGNKAKDNNNFICIHNLGNNKVVMYVWDESVASRGPLEIGSCIIHYVKTYISSNKLIMYSDQSGVSGHSFLPCDQYFGLVEKQKKFHPDIHLPDDWKTVIASTRKTNPFKVVNMTKDDFFSTKSLEKQITNRKIDVTNDKIQWMKIQ
ncbi:hypothetical protein QTP88_020096 [Uroleucon formosanum]